MNMQLTRMISIGTSKPTNIRHGRVWAYRNNILGISWSRQSISFERKDLFVVERTADLGERMLTRALQRYPTRGTWRESVLIVYGACKCNIARDPIALCSPPRAFCRRRHPRSRSKSDQIESNHRAPIAGSTSDSRRLIWNAVFDLSPVADVAAFATRIKMTFVEI